VARPRRWLDLDLEGPRPHGGAGARGQQRAQPYLTSGEWDLVVLDELTYTMKFGWIPVEEVVEALRSRHERTHVIVTGRDAPPELVGFADLVTEMREIKHPYKAGIKAQPGIEY
jgi:cob(I)alamin adenosyltransferase